MKGIWNESKGVAPESVEEFDEGESQVDDQEAEQVARVAIRQYETNPGVLNKIKGSHGLLAAINRY